MFIFFFFVKDFFFFFLGREKMFFFSFSQWELSDLFAAAAPQEGWELLGLGVFGLGSFWDFKIKQ